MIRLVYHFDIINIKELDVSKVIQVVVYKSVSDPEKLAAYAVLARPAMEKAGAKFIARGRSLRCQRRWRGSKNHCY